MPVSDPAYIQRLWYKLIAVLVWLKAHGSRAGSSKRPAPAVSPGTESQKIKRAKRGGTLILSTSSISHGHDTPYRLTSHDVVEFNVQLHATKHPLTALPPSRPYSSSATGESVTFLNIVL